MAENKLSYSEVPKALKYVFKTLWSISHVYVILSLVSTIVSRLFPYVTIFITAAITSRLPGLVTHREGVRPILMLLLALLAAKLASELYTLATQSQQQKAEFKVGQVMQEDFYNAYARLPYALYEKKAVIDAFEYAENFMSNFSRFGLTQVMSAVGGCIEISGATIALSAVAWYMPLLFLVFMPFLIRSIYTFNKHEAKAYKDNQSENRQVWAIEFLFKPRIIKETRLYGIVEYLLKQRRRLASNVNARSYIVDQRMARLNFFRYGELELVGVAAMAVAVWRIAAQGAPIGIFVLAEQLTGRATAAVQSLFNDLGQFDKDLYGFGEYRYITETLQPKQRPDSQPAPQRPRIELQDLSFSYPDSDVEVLHKLSLAIPFGSTVAIAGENGAGKTTLTKLMLGLYQPTHGSIAVNGRPLSDMDDAAWLGCIGVLLQDFGMNEDMTIRQSVWLGDISKPKTDAAIYDVLEAAELAEAVRALPRGLDTYLGKWIEEDNGVELSGGQLQRLAIARALFRHPDILLLDEPTSAIDALAEERIFDRLLTTRAGRTTIFISHRFSTVRRAQYIVFMDKGRIAEAGTHQELMQHSAGYARMYQTQAKAYE